MRITALGVGSAHDAALLVGRGEARFRISIVTSVQMPAVFCLSILMKPPMVEVWLACMRRASR